MDFRGKTAEEVFATVKEFAEGTDWEYKGKQLLDKDKHELRKDLGKQVSAFANSGGGQILLGINQDKSTKELELQPFDLYRGRQPFNEYLSNLIEQAVDYPVQTCEVVPCKSANNPDIGICVIDVKDSPSAPHMAKDHEKYFWRRDSNSEPAPHFHLELLRNRYTKTTLKVEDVHLHVEHIEFKDNSGYYQFQIGLGFKVVNSSLQVATHWGLYLKDPEELCAWQPYQREDEFFADGVFVRGSKTVLLPTEHDIVSLTICTWSEMQFSVESTILRQLRKLRLIARPISQNHVGDDFYYFPLSHAWANRTERQVSSDVRYWENNQSLSE